MDETQRKFGNFVCDFINAKTTDEACFKHLENMSELLSFQHTFLERVKDLFPSLNLLNSLPEAEKELLKLIQDEKDIKHWVDRQLSWVGYKLEDHYLMPQLRLISMRFVTVL